MVFRGFLLFILQYVYPYFGISQNINMSKFIPL